MSKFNIGTGDVLFALFALGLVGGCRLLCKLGIAVMRALGVI